MLDLDAIEARAEAATPGPWRVEATEHPGEVTVRDGAGRDLIWGLDLGECGFEKRVDADFIAHAREDVPAMAEEIRRLRAAYQAQVDGARKDGDWLPFAEAILDGATPDNFARWCFLGHHAADRDKQLGTHRFPDGIWRPACYKCEAEAAMHAAGVERSVKGIDKE